MQLDRHRIAIRERDFSDVLDLSLRVIREYAWPLAVAFACGVVPAMCLNAWLLADYSDVPFSEYASSGYPFLMLLLVLWQSPLVTAPITLYLGRALFAERPRAAEIAREMARGLPQLAWYQVIWRAVLIPWLVTWFFLFAVWPYLNEVILLERNPMFAGRSDRITTGQRRRTLHGGYTAELFARWLGAAAVGVVLFLSLWASICAAGWLLLGGQTWQPAMLTFALPLAMWLVFGYFAIVRFLGYLDLRIRREGWEVELMMRAERTRLSRQLK